MPARWQRDLEQAWGYRSTVILSGNIRDLYGYSATDGGPVELLELKELLSRWLARRVRSLRFYDPIDKFEVAFDGRSTGSEAAAGQVRLESNGPAVDDFAASSFDTSVRGQDAGTIADIADVARDLTSGNDRCCVIQFADRVAHAESHDPDNRDAIIAIEKLIHDMPSGNHLILIYLFSSEVPAALYANEPRTVVIDIPHPDRRDVREVFERRFDFSGDHLDRAVNACHGLSLREIDSVVRSLQDPSDIDGLERAVRVYKFGEESNRWDELGIDKLRKAKRILIDDEGIKGQDQAVEKVRTVLVRARADIQRTTGGNPGRPRGVLFFAGPTGVGKTMTAQKLAKFLFGDESSFLRFDMSEYQQEFQVSRLYGAPPGYVGFDQGGALTNPVQANPFRVVLFDEIEKANPRVFDIFLQILGDGRLTDSKGQVAHFSESFIIFTSNLGADSASAEALEAVGHDQSAVRDHFLTAVEEFFRTRIGRPELLNRIGRDNIVVFNYIDSDVIARQIIEHHLRKITESFNRSYQSTTPQLRLELPIEALVEALLSLDADRIRSFGGREVENLVNERVRDPLALAVLEAESRELASATITCTLDANGGPAFALA